MKLMYTAKDKYYFARVITEDCKYIRWCDEPLRKTALWSGGFTKILVGTVMPKDWMRQIMKLLTVLSGGCYIRITQYNLVIGFGDPLDNKLRKWNGGSSTKNLKQITRKYYETISNTQ